MRTVLLGTTLVITFAFLVESGYALARGRDTGLAVASLVVAGLFAFGIVGALRHPPGD